MNDRTVIICLSLILLLVSSDPLASAASIETHEEAVITCFSRGDYKALAAALEAMITEHPLDPVAVLHYNMLFGMAELFGPETIEKTAFVVTEKLRNSSDTAAGLCLLKIKCGLEKMLYRAKGVRGAQITNELKPVRKWTLYGPYHRYGGADMDIQFKPELLSSGRDISPQKRITIIESDGWLDPGKYIFPERGVVYASVSLKTSKPVKIRLYSDSSYKVFINGRESGRNILRGRRNVRVFRVSNSRTITVMVKIIGSPFGKMRMLVTDDSNTIMEPEVVQGSLFMDECDATEELDYPYESLVKEATTNQENGNRHLGLYFDDIENEEAIEYYKNSVSKHASTFTSYLLASALLNYNSGDRGSAGYNEGLAIINDLWQNKGDFAPARQKKVEHLISTGEFLQALEEGKRLLSSRPGNPKPRVSYLACLKALGYEKEFEENIALAKKEFPDYLPVLEAESEYYKKRDSNKFISTSLELIKKDISVPIVRSLLQEYISRGDYQTAHNLIQAYNFNKDFNKELVEMLIKKGDLNAARTVIFKLLMSHESPYFFNALGLIDMLQAEDPSMYLQKLLLLQPSNFSISDYIAFLESNSLENPFKHFLERTEPVGTSLFNINFGRAPSTILYRSRIFLLQKDGSSRVFCEDIVHVGNDEGVSRWGDIRIPYRGRIRPVQMSVYDDKGNRTDSYAMHSDQHGRYVNMSGLGKNSIVLLSYIVDNPVAPYSDSLFFSLPLEYLHHYDEPVHRVSIKIIAPEGMTVNFLFKDMVKVKKTSIEGLQVHEAVIESIPAIKKEPFAGGRQNCLHYFSFSTMDGLSDFTAWYRGLLVRDETGHIETVNRFKKDTLEKTISAIYDFIAREIELERNILYLPDSAENILFRKSGTPEDKVLLAQTLLKCLGINSYIAFARNRFLPGSGTCVYPEYFTHILLCVPLDVDNALWLDFSSRYFRCGVTSSAVAGSDAVVLLSKEYRLRKVVSLDKRSTVCRYDISIDEDGNILCDVEAAFIDTKNEMRKYFSNSLYWEESVHRFFSSIVPGFSMDSFRIDNYKEFDRPFVIAATGAGSGVAMSDSNRIVLNPVLNKCEIYDFVALPVRVHPLVIEKTINEKEIYRYTLPLHYDKQEITRTRTLANRFGICRVVITKKSGSPVLEVQKDICINSMVIEPVDYNEFVQFCLELKRIENETVILKKTTVPTNRGD